MEFKFRIWWIAPKIMIPWEDVQEKFNMSIFNSEWDRDRTISQFTGHRDYDGNEIYDGDILMCSEIYLGDVCQPELEYKVTWVEGGWECIPFKEPERYSPISIFDAVHNCNAEIVSNIFKENKQ